MSQELVIAGVRVLDHHSLTEAESKELVKLIGAALRARGYGMEYYMPYGRSLAELQDWCAQRVARDRVPANSFQQICENFLDTAEREAVHRMVCSATWDVIERHIKEHQIDNVPMPVLPYHLELLAQLPIDRQGDFWVSFWSAMRAEGAHIRALNLHRAIVDAMALPVESQTELVELPATSAPADEGGDSLDEIVFGDLEPVPEEEPKLKEAPGSGPAATKRSDLGAAAALRIVRICGQGWAETLGSVARIPDAQVILWAQQSEEHIEQIARLILGDYTSIDKAVKFVKDEPSDKNKIFDLKRKCMAVGGRYVLDSDGFHIVVTHISKTESATEVEV